MGYLDDAMAHMHEVLAREAHAALRRTVERLKTEAPRYVDERHLLTDEQARKLAERVMQRARRPGAPEFGLRTHDRTPFRTVAFVETRRAITGRPTAEG